jgi:chromatin remodeling complex protein RSC6
MPPKSKAEPKKVKATKSTHPVVQEPEPVKDEQQEKKVVTVESVMDELAKMKELHAQVGKMIQATTQMVKKLSKTMQPKKKRTRKAQTAPSGFARPGPITHELSTFLGIPKGEPVARTTVTKQMSAYIKEKGLQNPERKREIVLDDNLAKLFKMKISDTIEYFEIQKLLKNHYIKTTA